MQISTLATMTDWMHHLGANGVMGIERIMDWLKMARVQTLYWRAFDGGLAIYPSKLARPETGQECASHWIQGDGGGPNSGRYELCVDFNQFDALREAVRIGRERGISVHAWYTLCEEDHGGHFLSPLGKDERFRKRDRQGRDYRGTIDFFYPEVQQYKLGLLDELLERDVDGVLLDFVRSNATPNGDEDGIHRFGYNPEIRAAFKQQHGYDPLEVPKDDPRWLQFKRNYISDFVRKIKARLGDKPLSIMAIPDVDNPRWMCLDLPALSKDGTIQHVMAFGMTYNPSPHRTVQDYRALRKQVHRSATVAAGVQTYMNDQVDPEAFEAAVAAAAAAGAKHLTLYESDSLLDDQLLTSVRAIHLNASRHSRDIPVASVSAPPGERDWARAKRHTGPWFIAMGPDRERASAKTAFSVLRSPRALYVRVVCEGAQSEPDAEYVRVHKVYIDWLRDKFWAMADRAHVFVDPGASRRDYSHFLVGRNGDKLQGKRADNEWTGRWQGSARQISPTRWEAIFEIPFATLGRRPKKRERWGFQVIREQTATQEGSSWFVSSWCTYSSPQHWGDLIFS